MLPNPKYLHQPLEFWANVKLLNQRLGYTRRKSKAYPDGGFVVPSVNDVKAVFAKEGLNVTKVVAGERFTQLGELIAEYMNYRGNILTHKVKPHLMNKKQACELFYQLKSSLQPNCPLPMNKQKGEKRDYSFLTGMVNMTIEQHKGILPCDYSPKELTALTEDGFPVRTLSRRVDGAVPSVIDPIAIWEIKEYYYTTTFGSRVADGVYETQLDGWELWEAKKSLGRSIEHYLIVDDYFTWWVKGRSYLCRLIDALHMGLITEVLFGREIIERLPQIALKWKNNYSKITSQNKE